MSSNIDPFSGYPRASSVSAQHVPLLWKHQFSSVYARDPQTGYVQFWDQDLEGAKSFAQVDSCTEVCVAPSDGAFWGDQALRYGQLAVWGKPKDPAV